MPGPIHQGLLFLLRENPRLVFELARRFDEHIEEHTHYEQAANEVPDPAEEDNVLYADWLVAAVAGPPEAARPARRVAGVAVEVQTSDDRLKIYSWLSYAAGVRRVFECRGWTMVFAPDPHVRRRAQKMFEKEPRASPWFVEPNMLPPILDSARAAEDLDRAVLTAVFWARTIHGVAGVRATLEAMKRVAHPHRRVYRELMRASLTEHQLEQLPKGLFEIDDDAPLGPMELTGAYYVRGRRAGLEEGRQEGRAFEARRVLLRVLERRGLLVSDLERRQLETCEDLAQLEAWLDRALTAATMAELFG